MGPAGSDLGSGPRLVEVVEVEADSAEEVGNGADNEVGDGVDTCLGTAGETVGSSEVEL